MKRPQRICTPSLENGRDDASAVGEGRLVYVSQCVESESGGRLSKPSVADSRLLLPRSGEMAEQPAILLIPLHSITRSGRTRSPFPRTRSPIGAKRQGWSVVGVRLGGGGS